MPEGQQEEFTSRSLGEIARRAGVPNSAGGRNNKPKGRHKTRKGGETTLRAGMKRKSPRSRFTVTGDSQFSTS